MRGLGIAGIGVLVTALLEIVVLALVAHWIGVFWMVLLVLATSVLGGWLLRREGVRGWRRFRDAAQQGRAPGAEVSAGVVGLLGAILLVLPGFLTDLVGLALLVPPVRRLARARVQAFAERQVSPALATDLFGPRRVRVRRGPTAPSQPTATTPEPAAGLAGEPIEGEIVDR
jgi:UPF0716 protein FxsA